MFPPSYLAYLSLLLFFREPREAGKVTQGHAITDSTSNKLLFLAGVALSWSKPQTCPFFVLPAKASLLKKKRSSQQQQLPSPLSSEAAKLTAAYSDCFFFYIQGRFQGRGVLSKQTPVEGGLERVRGWRGSWVTQYIYIHVVYLWACVYTNRPLMRNAFGLVGSFPSHLFQHCTLSLMD